MEKKFPDGDGLKRLNGVDMVNDKSGQVKRNRIVHSKCGPMGKKRTSFFPKWNAPSDHVTCPFCLLKENGLTNRNKSDFSTLSAGVWLNLVDQFGKFQTFHRRWTLIGPLWPTVGWCRH